MKMKLTITNSSTGQQTIKTIKTYGDAVKVLNRYLRGIYIGIDYETAEDLFDREYSYAITGNASISTTMLIAQLTEEEIDRSNTNMNINEQDTIMDKNRDYLRKIDKDLKRYGCKLIFA
jgi:hypothetical protein